LLKLFEGGWFPLAIGSIAFTVLATWIWGRRQIVERRARGALPLAVLTDTLRLERLVRVPGTAIYLTAQTVNVPAALLHNMKHNHVLHERNVLMTVQTADVPRLPEADRLVIHHFDQNFHTVRIRYGFLEEPDIPRALALARVGGFHFNLMETSFFVGREKVVPGRRSPWAYPFQRLFVRLSELALDATSFFRIPVNRVVELGGRIEV
jgi:KUP system potassium uptake protein